MSATLGEVFARRDLLYLLAWREIRLKYKQSVMGMLWAVLMPTVIVSAGVVVRYGMSVVSGTPIQMADIASVSVRSVPWAFFVASLRFSTSSLISNANLLTKIYLPREIFPMASILSQLMDFAVASAVLVLGLAVLRVGVSVELLWVPVFVVILVAFAAGLGIGLSAASLFFRDVKYIVEIVLTFAIFFTPVFYEASLFGKWERWLLLNPVAPILEGLSAAIVARRSPDPGWTAYSAVVALLTLAGALVMFRRLEPYFAENV